MTVYPAVARASAAVKQLMKRSTVDAITTVQAHLRQQSQPGTLVEVRSLKRAGRPRRWEPDFKGTFRRISLT